MNAAAKTSCQLIEKTLRKSPAFKKVDEGLYVVKQGSSIVMINVIAWNPDRAVVRCVAQLVKGVTMEVPLALQLLEMNALLRFGAFAYVPAGDVIIFSHTLRGGDTLDGEELVTTIRDVAIIADEYDDRIAARYGGQTMQELLEESVIEHFRSAHGNPDVVVFFKDNLICLKLCIQARIIAQRANGRLDEERRNTQADAVLLFERCLALLSKLHHPAHVNLVERG